VAKRRWWVPTACKEGGYVGTWPFFVDMGRKARWAHEKTHPRSKGWVNVEVRRATDEELRLNLPGYEMTEAFYGR
jgi:hypothetical protein